MMAVHVAVYAFLAMFTLQILMSVLGRARFIKRVQATSIPERLAQLYPGVDLNLRREQFLTQFRAVTTGIVLLGLLLLGWLFSYMRGLDWSLLPVEISVCVYFLVQVFVPFGLTVPRSIRFNKAHKRSELLEPKRTAVLKRRGLFDFVSPFTVFVAVMGYLLFAAFVIYIQQHPFYHQHAGPVMIGTVSLVYAITAFGVYKTLYGTKPNPFETHEGHVRTMGRGVKTMVYSCIGCVAFLSLNLTLQLLHSRIWEPFALSTFFVVMMLLVLLARPAPPRPPEVNELSSGGPHPPGTRNLSA